MTDDALVLHPHRRAHAARGGETPPVSQPTLAQRGTSPAWHDGSLTVASYPVGVTDRRRGTEGTTERDLVVRAQRGDHEAFSTLAAGAYDRLHQVAFRILRDRPAAEDAAQQAVVSIWRSLPQLRDPGRFGAWSYRLLVNACNDEARRQGRRLPTISDATVREPRAPDGFGVVIDRDQLERAFERLSVDHRAVIVLHHYLDMPVEAVAEALDVPVGTVNSRLHRAITRMRMAMEADAPTATVASGEVSP